jgi:hypothetical protein
MPEWLSDSFANEGDVPLSWPVMRLALVRLGVALALGCVVAGVYRLTQGKERDERAGLTATLVLLTVLIALVTLVIGNNLARAFLLGALAMVRFRTVVEDPRDTAFVIFAVGVGMALGAGFLTAPLVGIPIAAVAAFLFRPRASASSPSPLDFTLIVRVGTGHNPDDLLRAPFGKYVEQARLLASATARQGAALEWTYRVRLRREDAAVGLVTELNGLAGVQSLELRPL